MTSDGARDLARAVRDLADRLPERLGPLARVAYNYRWSWTPGGEALFRSLDPMRFERCRGNPVRLLHQLPARVLEDAARDDDFLVAAAELQATIADDLFAPSLSRGAVTAEHPVAFVCAEFGIHRSLPICQGGLGVLAGDMLKGASDLRLPMVGVGILYSQGNFHQRLDTSGWQHDYWIEVEPDYLPAALVTDDEGAPLVVELQIRGRTVLVQVWRVQVGRVALYLLDANREGNGVDERWITARLYVGDRTVRLEQYALLGVGGVKVLQALGIEPSVVHINEGHGAFAPLALAAREVALGATREEALARARQKTVFTTHTPVAAGNETHDPETVLEVLGDLCEPDVLTRLGATEDAEIGMTSLGLRLSRRATAVSRVHGEVSRHMWRSLYDVKGEEDVPIGHVTNGVHDATWMAGPMRALLERHLGDEWLERADDPAMWNAVEDIADDELWATRTELRARFYDYLREADAASRLGRSEDPSAVDAAAAAFDPERLTLGFARRVATYKRLHLLLRDPDRLESLLQKPDTVQFVIAGKAHPRDTDAKAVLAELVGRAWPPEVAPRIAFLEDYDMDMASHLVAGCDVWVNVPRPPMEASGTSGMKSALNGGLNLSVLDGWWAEAYDGTNGWAIGEPDGWDDPDEQDDHDAAALFDLIENELLPMFHERDDRSIPLGWVARVKSSLRTIGPRFGTARVLREYLEQVYTAP